MATPLVALAFIVLPAAVAFAAVIALRRLFPRLHTSHDAAAVLFGVAGGAYGVLLSFLTVVAWEDAARASAVVEVEVGHLGTIWNLLDAFDEPQARPMREAIVGYSRAVVDDEWALLARDRDSEAAWDRYTELWRALIALQPPPGAERTFYDELVAETRDFSNARRLRLAAAHERVSGLMWAVLIGGAAVTIFFASFLDVERRWLHGLLTAALAALIGLVLFLIAALDSPWSGPVRLEPTSFRNSLVFWESQLQP